MTRCEHWDTQDAREYFQASPSCGAWLCGLCDHHAHIDRQTGQIVQNLARCWCGWAESGGNGREELEEMGEIIEPDEYDGLEYI